MSRPSCILCNKTVFTSKGDASSSTVNWHTGAEGYWWAHNACVETYDEQRLMHRLTEACSGDKEQAERVRDVLATYKRRPR